MAHETSPTITLLLAILGLVYDRDRESVRSPIGHMKEFRSRGGSWPGGGGGTRLVAGECVACKGASLSAPRSYPSG